MIGRRASMVIVAAVVLLGGCGDDRGVATQPTDATTVTTSTVSITTTSVAPSSALDGEWQVTSGIVNGEPVQLIDGAPITMVVAGAKLSGTAACNGYSFTIRTSDGGVELSDGLVNEMGCDSARMALQDLYLHSIGPSATYVVDGTLTWHSGRATWTFTRKDAAVPTPLVGTTWVLNGVLYEFGAMTTVGIERGQIVFAADGTVHGSTSCRDFSGTWTLAGTIVSTHDVTIDGECAGSISEVDKIVERVLDAGFSGSIDGDRLAARPEENLGLDYIAKS